MIHTMHYSKLSEAFIMNAEALIWCAIDLGDFDIAVNTQLKAEIVALVETRLNYPSSDLSSLLDSS